VSAATQHGGGKGAEIEVDLDDVARMAANLGRNRGYRVFPCRPDKSPATPRGLHDASNDPERVAWLWRRFPGALIGLRTGEASGVDALDIDLKHPSALAWMHSRGARLPQTRIHRTRSGGVHALFRHAPGLRNSAGRPCPGIDIRADGGYIIHWPAAGTEYLDHSPPTAWPQWLLDELRPPRPAPPPPRQAPKSDGAGDNADIAGIVRFATSAREGTRNQSLFWAGCRLAERVRDRRLSRSEAERLLLDAARDIGLDEREALRTIGSGMRGVA